MVQPKIFIVGKNEQYLGVDILDIKMSLKDAEKWVTDNTINNSDDPHTIYCYKELDVDLTKLFDFIYSYTVEPNLEKLGELWINTKSNKDSATTLMMKGIAPFHALTKQLQYAFYVFALEQKLFKPFTAYLRCRKRTEACKTCEFAQKCAELNK